MLRWNEHGPKDRFGCPGLFCNRCGRAQELREDGLFEGSDWSIFCDAFCPACMQRQPAEAGYALVALLALAILLPLILDYLTS